MTDRPHPDLDAPLSSEEAAEARRVEDDNDCCWLDPGDRRYCPGAAQCSCECHRQKRGNRRDWEILKIQDFERLESENAALVAEVRRLRAVLNEAESLLDCTEFALDWLILRHVIADGGKDWRSKFDDSAFFACDCSENGGYMDYDVNAYEHTERCASGFEDSLPALYDQIKALRPRARAALSGTDSGEDG